jgi:hypothetical protein
MQDGDVLGPALKGWIFRRLEPFQPEFVVIDPPDDRDNEALELPLIVPIGGQDPGAHSKALAGGGSVYLVDRWGRRGCMGRCGRAWTRRPYVHVLF